MRALAVYGASAEPCRERREQRQHKEVLCDYPARDPATQQHRDSDTRKSKAERRIDAHAAALARAGWVVVIAPAEQPCCGALMVHAGEESPALDLARRMIDTFESANVDVIVTNAGGCGSNVREYGYQLRDDPKYADRAAAFSATASWERKASQRADGKATCGTKGFAIAVS